MTQEAEAGGHDATRSRASMRALLRRYVSELDWHVDDADVASRSFHVPPTGSGADPLFRSLEGLYCPTPPDPSSARMFGFRSAILDALRTIAHAEPHFEPWEMPDKQKDCFAQQEIGQ